MYNERVRPLYIIFSQRWHRWLAVIQAQVEAGTVIKRVENFAKIDKGFFVIGQQGQWELRNGGAQVEVVQSSGCAHPAKGTDAQDKGPYQE